MERNEVLEWISAMNHKWNEAFQQQDPKKFAEIFTEDGGLFASDGKLIVGRKAVEEAIEPFMKKYGPMICDIQTDNIWEDGSIYYESGYYTYRTKADIIGSGTYVVQWKEIEPGQLRIYRDLGISKRD